MQGQGPEATWGCYDQKPNHPTPAEKRAFVNEVMQYARKAETDKQGGAPSLGILAIAGIESGYGWTRTAIYANNLFGRKAGKEIQNPYVLGCQPGFDKGNQYLRFNNKEDAVISQSEFLSGSWRYKEYTEQYRHNREAGRTLRFSVNKWIDGIADGGYNACPAKYKDALKRTLEVILPLLPADAPEIEQLRKEPNDFTFRDPPPVKDDLQRTLIAFAGALRSGRYLEPVGGCQPYVGKDIKEWDTFPLKLCRYSVVDTSSSAPVRGRQKAGLVILLDPSAEQLALWAVTACMSVFGSATAKCTDGILEHMRLQNGFQYPVRGTVWKDQHTPGLFEAYAFHDGVIVGISSFKNGTVDPLSDSQLVDALTAPVNWIDDVASISGATPEDYRLNGGKSALETRSVRDRTWLDVSRLAHQCAWNSIKYEPTEQALSWNDLLIAWTRSHAKALQ
jgi:hypothetical protein